MFRDVIVKILPVKVYLKNNFLHMEKVAQCDLKVSHVASELATQAPQGNKCLPAEENVKHSPLRKDRFSEHHSSTSQQSCEHFKAAFRQI